MKIGILTYHRAHNYGAYLQAAALCLRLNQEPDLECEVIDYRSEKEKAFYERVDLKEDWKRTALMPARHLYKVRLYEMFEKAIEDPIFPKTKDSLVSDSIDDFTAFVKGRYDVIVAGSDEVWKTDGFRSFPTAYWLTGDTGARRMAYAAASIPEKDDLTGEDKEILEKAVNRFEYIGLRDRVSEAFLSPYVHDKSRIHLCCDPTFLWDFGPEKKRSIGEICGRRVNPKKKNVLVMTEDWKLASQILLRFGPSCNMITLYKWHAGFLNLPDLNPLSWAEMIGAADLVITTFFHGACLSIQKETPFIAIGTKRRSGKIGDLFGSAPEDLKSRYFESKEAFLEEVKDRKKLSLYMEPISTRSFVEEQRSTFSTFLEALRSDRQKEIRNDQDS